MTKITINKLWITLSIFTFSCSIPCTCESHIIHYDPIYTTLYDGTYQRGGEAQNAGYLDGENNTKMTQTESENDKKKYVPICPDHCDHTQYIKVTPLLTCKVIACITLTRPLSPDRHVCRFSMTRVIMAVSFYLWHYCALLIFHHLLETVLFHPPDGVAAANNISAI